MAKQICNIMWFRRDLRLHDNAALHAALNGDHKVLPIFIFDKDILDKLEDKKDARVHFIHQTLLDLQTEIHKHNSEIHIFYGKPEEVFKDLFKKHDIGSVYTNHDYEPYAIHRDKTIEKLCEKNKIKFLSFKDQCLFEKQEVLKDNGDPYVVYTPYKNKHLSLLDDFYLKSYPSEKYLKNFLPLKSKKIMSLKDIGFEKTDIVFPQSGCTANDLKKYEDERNYPDKDAGTHLGLHLRFGTISIRTLARYAQKHSDTFLSELIWRDFFMQILFHFPHVVDGPFRKEYSKIKWRNNKSEFKKWCEGNTGYPMVDAGMRELNTTGYMHNRVRMLVASFLTKHLLIDWRWGEKYFAKKLLDFELSSNNGNWQWAAGCGCDAAPYFRVFNPTTQIEKFDPDYKYIKKWVPEYDSDDYPEPMVEHKMARVRAIETYKKALKN